MRHRWRIASGSAAECNVFMTIRTATARSSDTVLAARANEDACQRPQRDSSVRTWHLRARAQDWMIIRRAKVSKVFALRNRIVMTGVIKRHGPGFSREKVLCYLYDDKYKAILSAELVICLRSSVSAWNVYNRLLSIHGQTNSWKTDLARLAYPLH